MKKKLIAFDIYKTCLSVQGEEKILPCLIEKFNLQEQSKAGEDHRGIPYITRLDQIMQFL